MKIFSFHLTQINKQDMLNFVDVKLPLQQRSQTEGSEREFINAETAALSPNVSTPPYDSFKSNSAERCIIRLRSDQIPDKQDIAIS
ncbi:hypothetical protein KIN20_031633 [Parelaphostrongylus tenuis]|uniref:Uncharacterized protein n=1 Tax=Parelaphostrongylus tenuis TaxID=148309 RepID=A0AAD5R5Q5_PARTN|nr:hypothetical protein KIN20_031633 [Parelaphostrongylus tenuis]